MDERQSRESGWGWESTGLLILRVVAGLMLALGHGIGKLPPEEQFVTGVRDLGFPLPQMFAWAAALSESLGGFLMALGLFTRPAAIFVAITMGVAGFIVHAADPFNVKEKAFLYLAIAVAVALTGAGRYSLDFLIRSRKRRSGE